MGRFLERCEVLSDYVDIIISLKKDFQKHSGKKRLFLEGVKMIHSVGTTRQEAMELMRERSMEIYEKLKSGDTEEAIVTGGNAFTETVWNKMLQSVDDYLDEVKEDQKLRFAQMDKEQEEREFQIAKLDEKVQEEVLLEKRLLERNALQEKMFSAGKIKEALIERAGATIDVPYGYLAKDGIINYEGVIFVCDEIHNAICLGDMTNPDNVLNIPLEEGGCLKVNRDNIGELAKAISMFSPADIRRIMEAIATDAKCEQMQQELDETISSISGRTSTISKDSGYETAIAEQIAELFKEQEEN